MTRTGPLRVHPERSAERNAALMALAVAFLLALPLWASLESALPPEPDEPLADLGKAPGNLAQRPEVIELSVQVRGAP